MVRAYAQAYLLRRKIENESMWLNGIYTVHALRSVIGSAFGKKEVKYVERPLDIYEKTEAEKQQEVRRERQRLIEYLTGLKNSADAKQGVEKHGKP